VRITLQRRLVHEEISIRPCELCEAYFEPQPIIARIGEHGFEVCSECRVALLVRKTRGPVDAQWPTLEEYEDALRTYLEPVATQEEVRRADELGWYDDLLELTDLD
jgi:hypothetical protein